MGLPGLPLSAAGRAPAAEANQRHHHLHSATSLWNRLRSWPRDGAPSWNPHPRDPGELLEGQGEEWALNRKRDQSRKGLEKTVTSPLCRTEITPRLSPSLGSGPVTPWAVLNQRQVSFRRWSCVKNSTGVWRSCLGLSPRSTIYGPIIYHGSQFPNLKSGMTTNSPLSEVAVMRLGRRVRG